MHWLALLSGLAALTVVRIDEPATVAPLWLGGVLGTALGQLLALRRARLWLALVVLANAMFFGTLLGTPLWLGAGMRLSQDDVLLAFVPATVCAYLALRERVTLGGFWFPSVPWTLAMIESAGGLPENAVQRWGVVAGPALLLVGYLYTHEARRVSIWRANAAMPLASAEPPVVLRDSPARSIGRVVFGGAMTATVLALTAWIAPHLWQKETTERSLALAAGTDPACCPEVHAHATSVREYFTPMRAKDAARRPTPGCLVCEGGVPLDPHQTSGPAPTTGGTGGSKAVSKPGDVGLDDVKAKGEVPPTSPTVNPSSPPPSVRPSEAPVVAGRPHEPQEPREARLAGLPLTRVAVATRARSHGAPGARRVTTLAAPPNDHEDTMWIGGILLAAGVAHLGLRPLRRRFALRHLRRPLWPETPDQRISNLWQLLLVGLRDAGFRATPGEPPLALARRAAETTAAPVAEQLTACATVLERARHGVRLDAGDLEGMEEAATSIYQAARRPLAWPVRAAAAFRWPLV
jgi:hypothetical protein